MGGLPCQELIQVMPVILSLQRRSAPACVVVAPGSQAHACVKAAALRPGVGGSVGGSWVSTWPGEDLPRPLVHHQEGRSSHSTPQGRVLFSESSGFCSLFVFRNTMSQS